MSGKVGPGGMVCADLHTRRFWTNDEILVELSKRRNYQEWCRRQRIRLEEAASIVIEQPAVNSDALLVKQAQFGWTSRRAHVRGQNHVRGRHGAGRFNG